MHSVSFYKSIADTKSKKQITIGDFLESIKDGTYKHLIEDIRRSENKRSQSELKKLLPNITTSGTFATRIDKDLLTHSGLIQIDFDKDINQHLNIIEDKIQLANDVHSFAVFVSPSGTGLKVIVKVDPTQHLEIYKDLEAYYKINYNLNLDSTCINLSRAMFVSYDPGLHQNIKSQIFKLAAADIVKSSYNSKPTPKITDKGNEVEMLVKKIESSKIDITSKYEDWRNIGFALASEFNSSGEEFYHRISQFNSGYDFNKCSVQFTECCKARKAGIGINTLFAISKKFGVYAREPKNINNKASVVKNIPDPEIIFYTPIFKTDDQGIQVLKDIKINYVKFIELIFSFGYRRYDIDRDFIYIQVKDNVIKEVTILQIQDHFLRFVESLKDELANGVTKKVLKEKIYNNPKNYFCDNRLSLLNNNKTIEFNNDTKNEAFIYYQNGFVRCFKDGWELLPYSKLQGHIWHNQIINRDFKFTGIELENIPMPQLSVYAQFLFNISGQDIERFDSLCSLTGYLLHGYTDVKMKAIILTDSAISDEANGRTGKTLFGQTLRHIKKLTQINGKDFDPSQRYKYQEANHDTQIIFLNDVRKNFSFEVLYNDITEGITVEKKNQNPFTLKVKMIITTNKTIAIDGSSSKDRSIEFEFSDHYSEKFSPEDEFKQRFFSDWDTTAWQKFDNFMMYCIMTYFTKGILQPKNINLGQRKLLDQTHHYFIEFMNEKILTRDIIINEEFCKQDMHNTFLNEYEDLRNDKFRGRLETFTKWLKIFAKYSTSFSEKYEERKSGAKRYFRFIGQQ